MRTIRTNKLDMKATCENRFEPVLREIDRLLQSNKDHRKNHRNLE